MDRATEDAVRTRAEDRCEYCHFPAWLAELPFHFDHITAKQHGGTAALENLALACCFCNRFKGTNLTGLDPESGEITPLFHPRRDAWPEHFRWQGAHLIGRTTVGRTTVRTLRINRADAIALRELLLLEGSYPL